MSTVYYIINKKENDKYEKLCEFLKDESRKVLNDFIEFEKNFNCDSISDDVSYEINSLFNSLRYKLEPENIRFGQFTFKGFTFFDDFTCCGIRDIKTLKQYMKEHEDSIIEDECGEKFTLEQFIENVAT